jgi:hypothetical protein
MIADSYADIAERLDEALTRFAAFDAAAEVLAGLRDQVVAEIPVSGLDPDVVAMAEKAGRNPRTLEDTAPLVLRAADKLAGIQEAAASLIAAANQLKNLPAVAMTLHAVAKSIRTATEQLIAEVRRLRRLQ